MTKPLAAPVSQPDLRHQDLSRVQLEMGHVELALRKRIHFMEKHNQYFFRCESAWCNPDGCPHGSPHVDFCSICKAEVAAPLPESTIEDTICTLHDKLNCIECEGITKGLAYIAAKNKVSSLPGPTDRQLCLLSQLFNRHGGEIPNTDDQFVINKWLESKIAEARNAER